MSKLLIGKYKKKKKKKNQKKKKSKKKINWKIIGRVRRTWERGKAKNNNRN